MDGSRHERAALVGIAYFLGFLTTFIWYGGKNAELPLEVGVTPTQSAAVVNAVTSPSRETVEPETDASADAVAYRDGMLEVTTLGETRVLSFNPEVTGVTPGEEFSAQGTHVGDLIYTASPTDEYVFFCEQKALDAKTCLPFVYDALTQTIYPLRKDGDRVELLVGAAAEATWQGNQLSVGGEVSPDATAPWLLGRQ